MKVPVCMEEWFRVRSRTGVNLFPENVKTCRYKSRQPKKDPSIPESRLYSHASLRAEDTKIITKRNPQEQYRAKDVIGCHWLDYAGSFNYGSKLTI
jgi:hypothetical protein